MPAMTVKQKAEVFVVAHALGDPRCDELLAFLSAITGLSSAACLQRIQRLATE